MRKAEREYGEYTAELRRRYFLGNSVGRSRERRWFRTDPRSITTILARLVRDQIVVIQYGIVAALISVVIIGALSLHVAR